MSNAVTKPQAVLPLPLHDLAKLHFQRLQGQSLANMLQGSSVAIVADFTGFYGVADLGAVQIMGGARWDQIFSAPAGGK